MKCKDICLVSIKQKYPHARIILGGDFNCPGIDWEHGTLTESYILCHFRQKLITLAHDTQISQLVTFPTRAHNTLDLLFTTHPDSVLSCHPAPGLSDHDAVLATIQIPYHIRRNLPEQSTFTNWQIGTQSEKNYATFLIPILVH